jgi:hypothetical protein
MIDSVLWDLNNKFETTRKPLAATTGMIHDHLGITIDYSERDTVKFTMYDYLEDILDEMPMDMNGTSPTPVSDNLFDMEDDSIPLNKNNQTSFTRPQPDYYLRLSGQDQTYKLRLHTCVLESNVLIDPTTASLQEWSNTFD